MTDILDLIDGALEDYTVSADAARWVPDEASREFINVPARWVTAIDWVGHPRSAPTIEVTVAGFDGADGDFSWLDEHRAHAAAFGEAYLLVQPGPDGDSSPVLRPIPASTEERWRAAWAQVFTAIDEAAGWLNENGALAERLGFTPGAIWGDETHGWTPGHVHVARDEHVSPRCPAHQESGEPTDPMERALWLRRNRNTGPKGKARAPRRIDARRTR